MLGNMARVKIAAITGVGIAGLAGAFALLAPGSVADRSDSVQAVAGRGKVAHAVRSQAASSGRTAPGVRLNPRAHNRAEALAAAGGLGGDQNDGMLASADAHDAAHAHGKKHSGAHGAHGKRAGAIGPDGLPVKRAPLPGEVQKLRAAFASADPKERLAALRFARNLDAPELAADVRALLQTETNVPVKRVGTQILALGDATANQTMFEQMRKDPDAVVRVNAAFGMARAGDEQQQQWLLQVYDAARTVAPRLVPVLGAALEDPRIKSQAVVARFQTIAQDPKRDPTLRARAAAIVQAKLGG